MNPGARPWLKICGITCAEDARVAVDAGADAIGLNFVASSKRRIDEPTARLIVDAVRGRVELVAVVANETEQRLHTLLRSLELDWLQLHGDEPPSLLEVLPKAFKAIGIASAADALRAASYPGERLLVDTKTSGVSGGTGQSFDWSLVQSLVSSRTVILAGGLTPENVAQALSTVKPWGLDVASGVERPGDARRKDPERVARFIENARRAARDASP